MRDAQRSLTPAPARPGKQRVPIVAAMLTIGLLTSASACRQSGSQSTPAREEAPPAVVALQRGVIVVSAGSDKYGDDEEVMEIIDVTPDEVQLKYKTQSSTNNRLQHDFTRFVRRSDLISSHSVFSYRANRLPVRFSGTTSFGPSSAVLRELKTAGRTSFAVYLGRPTAPKTVLSVDELMRQQLMSRFDGELTRTTEVGPLDAVLVDGEPKLLPTIRARAVLTNESGARLTEEWWFLDDPANPLTLKSASSIGTSQVTKIFTPRGVNRANRLDHDLSLSGRVDVYDIFFALGDATMRSESEPALQQIADVLRSHRDWRLAIEGHTDNIGSDEDNQRLSERRAEGVKDALVTRFDIAGSRLTPRGFGKSRPKASNDTLIGRATNRRVELRRQESPADRPPAAAEQVPSLGARSAGAVMAPSLAAPAPQNRPLIDPLTQWIVSMSAGKVFLLTVLGGWLSLTVPAVLFLTVRGQYLRRLRASLYDWRQTVRSEGETAGWIETTGPPLALIKTDDVQSDETLPRRALAASLRETRRRRAAYAVAGLAYMCTATYLVWYDRAHNSVHSQREAIYVAYVTTAPSVVLIAASLRLGLLRGAIVAAGWIAVLLLLLVGVFRIQWGVALNLMVVDAAPLALMPIAANVLLLLRITRAMLVLLVPVSIVYAAGAAVAAVVISVMGANYSEMLQAMHTQLVVIGAASAMAGVTIAVMMIRAGVHTRWIAALVAVGGIGLLGAPRAVFLAVASVSTNALTALAAWWLFGQFVRGRTRRYLTDDLLHFSVCWFLLLYFVQAFSDTRWFPVPSAALPFAAYALVLAPMLFIQARTRVGLAGVGGARERPMRLLLLRVFAVPSLRRRLLDLLENSWRRVGRVDVVVGVDVALRTLSASTLEMFLRGRIAQHFIGTPHDVEDRLATLSDEPMADGLYPVNELHCSPQIWPDVVTRLATGADVVLVDVRRLQAANTGALFELSLAVRRVPLGRIVILADERTDERAVSQAIEQAWAHLPPDSPNLDIREPRLRWVSCAGSRVGQGRRIANAVFAAAFSVPEGPR